MKPDAGPGQLAIWAPDLNSGLVIGLGEGTAVMSGGVGGWQGVEREGRSEYPSWNTLPARRLTVPILIDGLQINYNMEGVIWALEAMGRPPSGSPRGTPPPTLEVGGMVPGTDRRWVMSGLDWGAAVWRGLVRVRQYGSIEFMEASSVDLVTVRSKKAPTRTYTVKKGDTLGSIARKRMGAKTKSQINKAIHRIKKANPKVRSSKSLKAGMKIKLPQ